MSARRFGVCVLAMGLLGLGSSAALGQDYPSKPIRIVTSNVGSSTDFASRLVAHGITSPLGQPVIVDNRSNGVLAGEAVSKSPPDGYTLLVIGSTFWTAPLFQSTPYDPVRDFATISATNRQPNLLVVHPSLPVKSVKELIALATAKAGALNYASGTGGTSYIAGELFKSMAGADIVRIIYKSDSAQTADLLSGQVHMTFATPVLTMPHVKTGKLRL